MNGFDGDNDVRRLGSGSGSGTYECREKQKNANTERWPKQSHRKPANFITEFII
jgi:hypothetical protein